jgi:hypothetical protein
MARFFLCFLAAAFVLASAPADAQSRRDRQDAARAQGVPPGQMPAPHECRVWYDDRPAGRQPAPTSCDRAEAVAARDVRARVIYGEDAYRGATRGPSYGQGQYGRGDNDRAVRRGSVRDPRNSRDDGRYDPYDRADRSGREGNVAFRNGYRDGMTKGREDAEDGDRYDATRHSWYRSATRGYENRHGTRYSYIDGYRRGFEAGYAEGYRVYTRR